MSTTVSYKGSVIATISNTVKKLLTKGKYLEDDITIQDSGGGSANLETLQVSYTPSETAISDTQTPSQGYDGFDEAQISVAAIPSSYVGSGITRRDSTDMSVSGDTVTAPAGYYENAGSKAVPAGSVTAPATITGTNADKFLGSGRLALQKVVDVTPVVTDAGYISSGTQGQSTVLLASDITVRNARTFHPSTSDQTVDTNEYINGTQTIKGVLLTNLTAANIKKDVIVKIGDSTDDDCVTAITGTYEGGGVSWDDIASNAQPSGDITISLTTIPASGMRGFRASNNWRLFFPNATQLGDSAVRECMKLKEVHCPKLTTCVTGYTFYQCSDLVLVDMGKVTSILQQTFNMCSNLDTLILRKSDAITTLGNTNAFSSTNFKNGGTGGTIYIPKVLYDHLGDGTSLDYKAATRWSTVNGWGTITWAKIEGSIYEL